MAKSDFCFTYYDGDAARDKAHMNRLERGAYDDLISAQRKFGHLSKKIIQKVLSTDFEKCWEALELTLKIDETGNFYIEWLEISIKKASQHSEHQRENGKKGGRPKNKTKNNPPLSFGLSEKKPLEDGNGNEDEVKDGIENEKELENPTLQHCEMFFQGCGLTREEGEIFFHHYEKQGWKAGNGQPVTNWASLAQSWILKPKDKNNGAKIRNLDGSVNWSEVDKSANEFLAKSGLIGKGN